MEGDVRVAVQQLADGKPHFRARQLIGSHLVEQRLERVIVTLVDERDPDVGIAQFLERADAAEPGTKDYYMRQCRHGLRSSSVRATARDSRGTKTMPALPHIVILGAGMVF